MLGELIGEERGKITSRRVLPSNGSAPKVEVSMEADVKLLGQDAKGIGTYWSVVQPTGFLYGEGQGVVMTSQGESIQWTGAGRGEFTGQGGVKFRGAVYYQTTAERFARLNGIAIVFEHEVDGNGNLASRYWEWK
jgi:hypothetical protein